MNSYDIMWYAIGIFLFIQSLIWFLEKLNFYEVRIKTNNKKVGWVCSIGKYCVIRMYTEDNKSFKIYNMEKEKNKNEDDGRPTESSNN